MAATETLSRDEQRLAELGYKQDLHRGWSSFSNFAISFTIISVLAGCFTLYSQAWNNGGPIAISIGWPVISLLILTVAFSMSELVSAMPTAGGIYYWASEMGGPVWGWFTGWFNLIGLVAVVASVDYAAAIFGQFLLALYKVNFIFDFTTANPQHILTETFAIFVLLLLLHALLNIFSSHLVSIFNGISVWWHVIGVAVIVGILVLVPSHHQSLSFVFTKHINNSGFGHGMLWFYVLPLGFLLTMYTITGYDASAHLSEETHGAEDAAPKGVWRSVFYSAVIGWVVLLAITFAANDPTAISAGKVAGAGSSLAVFVTSLTTAAAKGVILISVIGQIFCGMACLTSASRMTYAFSRDGAIPGWRLWSKLNKNGTPTYAVLFVAVLALIITLPALKAYTQNGVQGVPVAFLAVTSISVIGLYIAYTIPIFLRWRQGASFNPGPWTLGAKYKWVNMIAIVWVGLCVIIFCVPFSPAAVFFSSKFDWRAVNYAPIITGGTILLVGIWWLVSAKRTFTGPRRNIDVIGSLGPTPHLASPEPTMDA
jgi:amino acid transporter